jgi:hypothetical protein
VARLPKKTAPHAKLDRGRLSGHSLHRGLLTNACDGQEWLRDVMCQSRHVQIGTALSHMEDAEIWHDNIAEAVFARKQGTPSAPNHIRSRTGAVAICSRISVRRHSSGPQGWGSHAPQQLTIRTRANQERFPP